MRAQVGAECQASDVVVDRQGRRALRTEALRRTPDVFRCVLAEHCGKEAALGEPQPRHFLQRAPPR
jgi:hypothetical protein